MMRATRPTFHWSSLLLLPILATLPVSPMTAAQTVTVPVTQDTYVREGAPNTNEGASPFLRVESAGDNRALVRVDDATLQAATNGAPVSAATLRVVIAQNGENWGPNGRLITAHRLKVGWSEGNGFNADNPTPQRGTGSGATWRCAVDGNIADQQADCSGPTAWGMERTAPSRLRAWIAQPTGSARIQNGQSGVVEFDVTADVQAFQAGTAVNHGWLIKKAREDLPGRVLFGSRESVTRPELVLTFGGTAPNLVTQPDSDGILGSNPSITLDGAGWPVVFYRDEIADTRKLLRCGDVNCEAGNVITPLTSTYSDDTTSTVLLDDQDRPIISYINGDSRLEVLHCGTPTCASGNTTSQPDSDPRAQFQPSMQLDSAGNPVIAYSLLDGGNGVLRVLRCGDAGCTTGNTLTTPTAPPISGPGISLALDSADRPVVAYPGPPVHIEPVTTNLVLLRCGDPTCTSSVAVLPDNSDDGEGILPVVRLTAGGVPVVAFFRNVHLQLVRCGDPTCASSTVITVADAGQIDQTYEFRLDSADNPVFLVSQGSGMQVARCDTPGCEATVTVNTPDEDGRISSFALTLDGSGNPVAAYYSDQVFNDADPDDPGGNLKALHCANPACAPPTTFHPTRDTTRVSE